MKTIGIDVGGTNTDAVLVDNGRVLRSVKAVTTPDVTSGIVEAIRKLDAGPGVAGGRTPMLLR
jgi:N-methylhydantoinase A/oxoprolinase/acetone carboxylase beta subunit